MTKHPNGTRARSAFIIATYNRPKELLRTVQSLVNQSVLPYELCIVDASDMPAVREEIEILCERAGVELVYRHPASPSLTAQRNLGIELTSGDPVFFVDDDVELEPDCHEAVLVEYERHGDEVGGVCATSLHPPRPSRLSVLYRRFFGIGGRWPDASGKVRRSLHAEGISVTASTRDVEYFPGWFMSFRRSVFQQERFDENLTGYAHKEDLDFSFRVSRRFRLIQTPDARCHHFKSPGSRISPRDLQRMHVLNQTYLHKKLMPQDIRHRVAFWWAFVGHFFFFLAKAAKDRDPGWVVGLVSGALTSAHWRDHESSTPVAAPDPEGKMRKASTKAVDILRRIPRYLPVLAEATHNPRLGILVLRLRRSRLTYLEPKALGHLGRVVADIEHNGIEGEFIEAGCGRGGSAILLAHTKSRPRPLSIYDVFGLIPSPTEKDGPQAQARWATISSGEARGISGDEYYGYSNDLLSSVRQSFKSMGIDPQRNNVTFIPGLFQETLKPTATIAFAHIDCDWYDSVRICLERIEPQLAPGGVIVVDDYFAWAGCKKAVDEYFGDKRAQFVFRSRPRLTIYRKNSGWP